MREMMRNKIKSLNLELIEMASLVEKQIFNSVLALKNQDLDFAKEIMKKDDEVDNLQRDIEEKCIKLMATESPVAKDLRSIYTTSKIVTDLERMADYAVDICKIVPRIKGLEFNEEMVQISEMVDIITKMIKLGVEAYLNKDDKAANEISDMDDKVDIIYKGVFKMVLNKTDKEGLMENQRAQVLFVAKYLERVGDHITNICEWIIFSKKGKYVDLNE